MVGTTPFASQRWSLWSSNWECSQRRAWGRGGDVHTSCSHQLDGVEHYSWNVLMKKNSKFPKTSQTPTFFHSTRFCFQKASSQSLARRWMSCRIAASNWKQFSKNDRCCRLAEPAEAAGVFGGHKQLIITWQFSQILETSRHFTSAILRGICGCL